MHFWGLTVDTVTTIQLILAIGLSVDYSAHIGHAFMASREGSRVGKMYINFHNIYVMFNVLHERDINIHINLIPCKR